MNTKNSNKILIGVVILLLCIITIQSVRIDVMSDNYEKHQDSYWRQVALTEYFAEINKSFNVRTVGNGVVCGVWTTESGMVDYGYVYDPTTKTVYDGTYVIDGDYNYIIDGHLIVSPWN